MGRSAGSPGQDHGCLIAVLVINPLLIPKMVRACVPVGVPTFMIRRGVEHPEMPVNPHCTGSEAECWDASLTDATSWDIYPSGMY